MPIDNQEFDVVIVGAGLSGLTAATRLSQAGKSVCIAEARQRIGGRIHTVSGNDLGPTWFWGHQQNIINFLNEHNLKHFIQFEDGLSLFEQIGSPPQQFRPTWQQPISYRVEGGMMALINVLVKQLPPHSIRLDHVVKSIKQENDGNITIAVLTDGQEIVWSAKDVVVTLPPHLAATTISYQPSLPVDLKKVMHQTPTWMGEAMKISLTYSTPFWRGANLSGMAISYTGPVQQWHDASPADGKSGALFGWIGNGGSARSMAKHDRMEAVIHQAVRLFGPEAAHPISYAETNWEQESFTTNLTDPDRAVAQQHPHYGHPLLRKPFMNGRLWWATTEASPVEGGYLDGAIYIGRFVAQQIIDKV